MQGSSRWIRCPKCGHKLFKDFEYANVEIKCSSCKSIVTVTGGVTVGCTSDDKERANDNRGRRRIEHNLE